MAVTDDAMREMLANAREYTVVLLRMGPSYEMEGRDAIVWEHGRRNFSLRQDGTLALVGPLDHGVDPVGLYVFTTPRDETVRIMDADPAVRAGIFTYTVHAWTSFPGDALP